MSLKDAVASATAPYRGFTYYATGNRYYDPAQTAALIDKYNEAFKLNLTPEEITSGIQQFGDTHRKQFGFAVGSRGSWDNQQSWNNQNGAGNFTTMSDPVAIARESIANVLRARGTSEETIQSKFFAPIASESTAGTKWAEDAAAGLAAAQQAEWRKLNPEIDTSWGALIRDLASDPAVMALAGIALAGSGALGSLGGAGAADAATLAAGDAMAGIGATEAAAAATAASETAAMSAWAGLPAETGGSIVGSNGLIGSTGNAIGDAVLNNSIQSGLTSAVSGGDPVEGALRGAAGGLISSSGVLNDVSAALTPSDAGQVATNAISRGVNAAGTAAVTGGDPVTTGATSLIGNYVGGTVAETGAPPVVAGAAGGGAAGATGAALNGGDIANGLITGAAGGGASGLASQLGANSGVASGIGSIVGGVVGSELADDQTAAGPTPVGTPAPTPTPFAGMTFADMLPPEFVNVTRTTDWGSNRLATAGRI